MRKAVALDQPEVQLASLLEQARSQQETKPAAALTSFKKALALARTLHTALELGFLLEEFGTLQRSSGHTKLAIHAWGEAAVLLEDGGRFIDAGKIWETMGQAALDMRHLHEAFTYYAEALDIYLDARELPSATKQMERLGWITGQQGSQDMSAKFYAQARAGYRLQGDPLLEAQTLLQQAEQFMPYFLELPKALAYLRLALDLLKRLEAQGNEQAEPLIQQANACFERIKQQCAARHYALFLQESEQTYQKIAAEAGEQQKQTHHPLPVLETINAWGLLRHDVGRLGEEAEAALAIIHRPEYKQWDAYQRIYSRAYHRAIAHFRAQHQRQAEAIVTGTLALIAQTRGKCDLHTHQDVLALYREAGDLVGQGRTLVNRGIWHMRQQPADLEEALACFRVAVEVLAEADAAAAEQTAARQKLTELQARLGPALSTTQKESQALYETLHPASAQIAIQRAPLANSMEPDPDTTLTVERAPNLLEAIRVMLSLMLEEAGKANPAELEWTASGNEVVLTGHTTGVRLLASPFEGDQPMEQSQPYRLRLLEVQFPPRSDDSGIVPFPAQPHIQLISSRQALEEAIIAHLDHHAMIYGGRIVEVLDQVERPVLSLRWGSDFCLFPDPMG